MASGLKTESQLQNIVPYPELPPELVHNIFHYAARRSTPFCLTLCRVSSWARQLALPHLYSTVILRDHNSSSNYMKYLRKSPFKPPQIDFQPTTVLRSLWIEAVSDRIISIFDKCDNLVHIALHADNLLWLVHASSEAGGNRLSHDAITRKQDLRVTIIKGDNWTLVRLVNFEEPNRTTPLFSQITHLRLIKIRDYETDISISHLTRLTHLAVPFWLPSHDLSALDHILGHHSLELLVVVVYVDLVAFEEIPRVGSWYREKRAGGQRVSIVESTSRGIQEEWEEEVRGGKDMWSLAAL